MKKSPLILLLATILLFPFLLQAQTLTLEECQQLARAHYPAIAQFGVIENVKDFNLENANKAYFPQLSLSAKATYQSDVIKVPIEIPGLEFPTLDKDQYQFYAQLEQLIWDGGKVGARKEHLAAGAEVEKQKIEAEVYSLRERVNQVFFGILLLREQLEQQSTLEGELQRNFDKVQSYVDYGVAGEADLSAVKVEQLKAKQQRIQMESALESYLQVLSILIGEPVEHATNLVKPDAGISTETHTINRPELKLFDAQEYLLDAQKALLNAKNRPVIGAFAQGGYGKPALNIFENSFKPYLIGGVTLSWNLSDLYTYRNEKKSIDQQRMAIGAQRETFLYNLHLQLPQQQSEIEKYRLTMQDDDEIIRLRTQIKEAAEAKVENGTMTVSDLLQEINALEIAKQAKSLHEIQYLISVYNVKYTTNQ